MEVIVAFSLNDIGNSMMSNLLNMKGKNTIITGAAGKLGKSISFTLAELGSNLILVDLCFSDLLKLKSEIQNIFNVDVKIFEVNLEIELERQQFVTKLKNEIDYLNCLINNAAFVGTSDLKGWAVDFENQSLETWRRAFEVNVTAPFHLSQLLSDILRLSQDANIINISSIYGYLGPDWNLYNNNNLSNPAAYSCSKGALIQLTRWLSTTLAPDIRVNSISPGGIYRSQPKNFVSRYEEKTPLKRMAKEEDLAGTIAFLASNASEYMTGENLIVDGGFSTW